MSSISLRMAPHQKLEKGVPRPTANYRAARRNAVRAEIRREAVRRAASAFPGWSGRYDDATPLDRAA